VEKTGCEHVKAAA
jgi:hypothetical protein